MFPDLVLFWDANLMSFLYFRLSMKYHPDRNAHRGGEAADAFKQVAEAYQTLANAHSRQEYDIKVLGSGHQLSTSVYFGCRCPISSLFPLRVYQRRHDMG